MSKTNSVTIGSYYPKEGALPVRMTNDLLFHYLLQDHDDEDILKGIISSFCNIPIEEIKSVVVQNPISYGEKLDSKTMVLDVKALLNDNRIINLEMQVINYNDWPERSISYICRCFDNLLAGQGYLQVKGAFHIGFLDFTLFPDNAAFYTTYSMRDDKTNRLYSSKFGITVVDLTLIDNATEDDKAHHRDLWASFFKAKTWEEIHMLATQDKNIERAAIKLYTLSEDQRIRDEIWAREDQLRRELDMKYSYEAAMEEKNQVIKIKDEIIRVAQEKAKVAQKELKDKDDEIAALRAKLAKLTDQT